MKETGQIVRKRVVCPVFPAAAPHQQNDTTKNEKFPVFPPFFVLVQN